MGTHWEDSHFGDFESDIGCLFGSDINGVDYVGVDFAGEISGVDFVGIDFAGELNGVEYVGVDFGIEPLTLGVLGLGLLTGAAATGDHLLSIHHLLREHKRHPTPAHAGATALSEHDAEVAGMNGPSAADPFQLGG